LQVFKNAGYVFELEKQFITPKEEHLSIEPEKVNVKIGIAPFAAHKSKQWGMTRIISLIEAINKQYEVQYYLFGGGKSEVKQLNRVENIFPNVTNLAGKFNLRQEMHLIADLDVMICMDSGNMHIASLLGIPVISIWGGTHPGVGFSALYQPQENSIQLCEEELKKCKLTVFGSSEKQIDTEPYFCITKINIETVINRLIELEVLQLSTSKF
jgi:ADP-heptose:LPS heptosyltransferase